MAFRIAVSGLRAATADLDVTGNNIANSNTVGFKQGRAQFADLYAASNLGVSQFAVGQGTQLSSIAQQFAQGNVSFTDNNLDLAINGEGFFVLDDNGSRVYSRAGAFGVDKDGFIVNATGQSLVGFQANNGVVTGAVGNLQLNRQNIAPQPTDTIAVQVNVDAGDSVPAGPFDPTIPSTYNRSTSFSVFDSLGNEHLATLYFQKTGVNAWNTHMRVDGLAPTTPTNAISFGANGALVGSVEDFGTFAVAGANAIDLSSVDFSGTTQYGAEFGVNSLSQNGFSTGQLSGITIDDAGVVLARFSNGESQAQGQVALANFSNPQGLSPLGETLWSETNASGTALVGAPGTASLGLLQSGALEESNVELAEQLVNMIIAQRNFQANAQVIRTEDEVTQTIINMR